MAESGLDQRDQEPDHSVVTSIPGEREALWQLVMLGEIKSDSLSA